MYNEEFAKKLEKDNNYNDYLDSNWSTINTIKGKVKFNNVLLGASKFALVASGVATAYCGANIIATLVSPKLTIFNGISYLIGTAIGVKLTKSSYNWSKHIKQKIADESAEEQKEIEEHVKQYKK